jgi:hypothetical protein
VDELANVKTDTFDVELAVLTLLTKTRLYNTYFAYYEGNQPLVYSNERLKEAFDRLNARFTQNWCAVVVDSVLDRLSLQGITIADDESRSEALAELLDASELPLEADDVHLAAMVTGEAYIIAWPDEAGMVEAYYNDPRNVHVFYEADKPRTKRFAAKWWIGDDGHRYLTLYYVDRLEYYRSGNAVIAHSDGLPMRDKIANEVTNGKSFIPLMEPAANDFGIVPVFHFRRERRVISSELTNIIYPQDAVNKLLADMMIAAEFGAFKQRWVISEAGTDGKLKNAPNLIWDIPAGDGESQPTSVGEFDITPLQNYLDAIDKWTTSIAIISRTPKHYFYGQGGEPSGEALIALESPLNHKAQKYIDRFTVTWSELAQFMMRAAGMGDVPMAAIIPVYGEPETVQPYTQSLIRKESVAAGIPLMWQMKQEGYTEQELAELDDAVTEKADADTERMAQVMEQRASAFGQNGSRPQPRNGQPPQGNNAR